MAGSQWTLGLSRSRALDSVTNVLETTEHTVEFTKYYK